MNNNITVIGLDIGGTKISAALFLLNGEMLRKEIRSLEFRKGDQVMELACNLISYLIDTAKATLHKVIAIGVCVPGIYNPINKTAWAPNIPDWDQYPIWDQLTSFINDPSIVVTIESDRSCYILGEIWQGSAKGCTNAIFVAVGTGIGAGILSNGRIVQGNSGIAGAIGWMAMEANYNDKYIKCGNFEHDASGSGIARSAVEILGRPRKITSILDGIPLDKIRAPHVFQAFERQDPVAVEVINKAIVYWGKAVANLVSIFNPQKVIFGGGVFGPASTLLNRIHEEAKKWAQPLAFDEISLNLSTLDGNAGLIGAGYLAITSINEQADDLS